MARRTIPIIGFDTGLVDDEYLDRLDSEAARKALRECENFVHTRSGSISTRDAWGDAGWATKKQWGDDDFVRVVPFYRSDDDDYSFFYFVYDGTHLYIWKGDTWDTEPTQVAVSGTDFTDPYSSITDISYTQLENKMIVSAHHMAPLQIEYEVFEQTPSFTYGDFPVYAEASGLIETARFASLTGVSTAPQVGELVNKRGVAWSAVVLDVLSYTPTGAKTANVVLGNCTNYTTSLASGSLDFLSSGASATLAGTQHKVIFGTGTRFEDEFTDGATVRIGGTDYDIEFSNVQGGQLCQIVEDGGVGGTDDIVDAIGPFAGVKIAKLHDNQSSPSSVKFTSDFVTNFQNRVVFANVGVPSFDILGVPVTSPYDFFGSPIQGNSRVVMSSTYDVNVITPVPRLEADPSAPIDVEVLMGQDDSITWVMGGDSLFLGTTGGVYAVENNQYIGNTSEALPRFKRVSDYGSEPYTPVAQSNGQILFISDANEIQALSYNDGTARFNGVPINASILTEMSTDTLSGIFTMHRTKADNAPRIIVRGASKLYVGTWLGETPAWSIITIPEGLTMSEAFQLKGSLYMWAHGGSTSLANNGELYKMTNLYNVNPNTRRLDRTTSVSGTGPSFTTSDTYYRGRTVVVYGEHDGNTITYGEVDVDASGNFTTGIEFTSGTVNIGMPFTATATLGKIMSEDEIGVGLNRKHRLIKAHVSYQGARQFNVNGESMLNDFAVGFEDELDPATGVAERGFFGWQHDRQVTITSEPPYPLLVRSVTLEVSL